MKKYYDRCKINFFIQTVFLVLLAALLIGAQTGCSSSENAEIMVNSEIPVKSATPESSATPENTTTPESSAIPESTTTPEILENSKNIVTYDSIGQVKTGMTVAEASKVFGMPFTTIDEGSCRYFRVKGDFKDVAFMVTDGTIARFDISEPGFATAKGAKVGDSEEKVKNLYKESYKVSGHPYVEAGHYITINSENGKNGIIFETDGKVVTEFRAGRFPEVGFIEGCS